MTGWLGADGRRIGRVRCFLLGVVEARSSFGMTFDDDPWSPRSRAYDRGRALGARLSGS